MVAHQHCVTTRRQDVGNRCDIGGVERRAAEIGEDERRRHRRQLLGTTRPWHYIIKRAWSRTHFTLAIGLDTTAWPELHALGTIVAHQLFTARHRRLPQRADSRSITRNRGGENTVSVSSNTAPALSS